MTDEEWNAIVESRAKDLATRVYARGPEVEDVDGPEWDNLDSFDRKVHLAAARAALSGVRELIEAGQLLADWVEHEAGCDEATPGLSKVRNAIKGVRDE